MSTNASVSQISTAFNVGSRVAIPAEHEVHAVLKPVREFSSFIFDASNREIVAALVDRLEDSVASLYLLDLYPIVVTPDRIVIDGQHRLKMARNLMIPFYFLSGEDICIEDVANANVNTKKFTIEDAAVIYQKMGMEPYEMLGDFLQRHQKFTLAACASWLSSNYHERHAFVEGKYQVTRPAFAEKAANAVADIAKYNGRVRSLAAYRDAITRLVACSFYDHERMLERVANRPRMLVNCGKREDALAVLEEIYNYKKAAQNRVSFESLLKNSPVVKDEVLIANELPSPTRGMVNQKTTTVFRTCDYDMFSLHPCARPMRDLNGLISFMKDKNLFPYYPIIVDDANRIIDGQRRYMAAKELGLPLYYIRSGSMSLWMAAIAGGVSKTWGLMDYVSHFAARGYPEYVWVKNFIAQNPSIRIYLVLHSMIGALNEKIAMTKAGAIKFNRDFLNKVADLVRGIKDPCVGSNDSVIRAIGFILDRGRKMERLGRLHRILDGFDANDVTGMTYVYIKEVIVDAYNKGLTNGRIDVGED